MIGKPETLTHHWLVTAPADRGQTRYTRHSFARLDALGQHLRVIAARRLPRRAVATKVRSPLTVLSDCPSVESIEKQLVDGKQRDFVRRRISDDEDIPVRIVIERKFRSAGRDDRDDAIQRRNTAGLRAVSAQQ